MTTYNISTRVTADDIADIFFHKKELMFEVLEQIDGEYLISEIKHRGLPIVYTLSKDERSELLNIISKELRSERCLFMRQEEKLKNGALFYCHIDFRSTEEHHLSIELVATNDDKIRCEVDQFTISQILDLIKFLRYKNETNDPLHGVNFE